MKIGTRIEDRYSVQEQIGEDTFVVVSLSSGVKWILKALPHHETEETIRLLQMIRHPSLPRVFETFEIEGNAYYLVEYIEGSTLLELCNKKGGKLPYLEACDYMARISRTLYFLHAQNNIALLHLDVKPENIIVTAHNLPCLIDYGSMRKIPDPSPDPDLGKKTEYEHFLYGTPGYMPPEMIQGQKPTVQSDIFMIGMTLLRLISGQEPNPSLQTDVKSLTSMMPAIISKTILRCIMNRPEDRYGNAGELACDLENACETTLRYDTFPDKEYSFSDSSRESSRNKEKSSSSLFLRDNTAEYRGKKKSSQNRVLCVWNNGQFAVELSSVLAKQKKSVLIIDADLLSPEIDLLVEIEDTLSRSNRSFLGNSSLADLMEEYVKKRMSTESIRLFAQKTSIEGMSCLCGDYRMEDYEYYSTEGLVEIIKTAALGFDCVVVSCGKFIYDEFTCVSQICADLVFVPIIANSMQFREFNRYINFLAGRKQLEREKIRFIAYDYMSNEDLSYGTCDELCNGSFAGSVSFSSKRRMLQGTKKTYIDAMESKIEKQYLGIIKKAILTT